MNVMSWIKEGVKVFLITISLYLVVDFATTYLYGARAFSIFFVSNNKDFYKNKGVLWWVIRDSNS